MSLPSVLRCIRACRLSNAVGAPSSRWIDSNASCHGHAPVLCQSHFRQPAALSYAFIFPSRGKEVFLKRVHSVRTKETSRHIVDHLLARF